MPKGKYEIVGDQQALGDQPVPYPAASPKMGKSELVGDTVPLNRQPVVGPSNSPKMGKVQLVGDAASLNRTIEKGRGSHASDAPVTS